MTSSSVSESCCTTTLCSCEDWLTAFCDYQVITLSYCGETTQFEKSRSKSIRMQAVNPEAGVHPSDRVFRVSMLEQTVEVGIGAVITDASGTEWVVYAVEDLAAFCVKVLYGRSVAACFQLLENIDVLEPECKDCDDCEENRTYNRVGRVKGKIIAASGSLSSRNDSSDLVYTWTGDLVRWPLTGKPASKHRLRTREGSFRITQVIDNGPYVPFRVTLEKEDADCTVRRQS